jgi:hypothetical protein
MKMIEKVSKKTFVNNVEHTKLKPNKQFTSIKPGARTQISPPDSPSNYRGFKSEPLKNAKEHLHSLQGIQGSYYKEARSYSQELAYHSQEA